MIKAILHAAIVAVGLGLVTVGVVTAIELLVKYGVVGR
jgi:hypothetical protein